jgi:hypothetical protein
MLYFSVRFGDCSERRRLQREKRVQVRPLSSLRRGGSRTAREASACFCIATLASKHEVRYNGNQQSSLTVP